MNTLPKSLTIAFIAVFIFISGFNVDLIGAQDTAVGTAASRSPADLLQSRYLRFGRLTAEDGLSGNQTYNVVQDNHGFMWFATSNGLSRYDGSSIKVYRHDPDDPSSLGHNFIRSLIVDQSGVLWVGTWGGGLNQYDREKDAFIRYQHNPDNPHSLSNNVARTIYEDRNGTIWVGTHGGLNKLDRKKKQFTHYLHDPDEPNSLSHNTIRSIYEDRSDNLWLGTRRGLSRFNRDRTLFTHYTTTNGLPSDTIYGILEDEQERLWLSTTNGLSRSGTRWTARGDLPPIPTWIRGIMSSGRSLPTMMGSGTRRAHPGGVAGHDLYCVGMDGSFKYLNPAWETNLGYTDEELLSRKFLNFVHPDDRAKTLREFESLAAGRTMKYKGSRQTRRDPFFCLRYWSGPLGIFSCFIWKNVQQVIRSIPNGKEL